MKQLTAKLKSRGATAAVPDTGAGGRRISELVLLPRGTAQPAWYPIPLPMRWRRRRAPVTAPTGRRSRCGRRRHRDLRR